MEDLTRELHTLNELLATHFNTVDAPKYGWLDDSPYDKILAENLEAMREAREERCGS